MGTDDKDRGIPSSTLATLRGILVSSLSRENLGPHDLPFRSRKVHFHEGIFSNPQSVNTYNTLYGEINHLWDVNKH